MKTALMSLIAVPPGVLGLWALKAYVAKKKLEHLREKRNNR